MLVDDIKSEPIDCRFSYEVASLREHLLTVGKGTYSDCITLPIYKRASCLAHVLIGRFSALADKITFHAGGNHNYKNVSIFPFDVNGIVEKIFGNVKSIPNTRPNHFQVIVGHDVWIASNVTVMGGVKIGTGAVIGASAVVTKDVPPYSIVVGNPARVIKYRFDEATIKKLLDIKWWNWNLQKIADNLPLMTDVEKFLAMHWSPELEQIPEDEIGQAVESIRAGGGGNL